MSAGERPVVLVGMMGAGKTTVGRLLAAEVGRSYVDSDAEVERDTGHSVAELFATVGEPAFRAEEAAVLRRAVAQRPPVVCSAGGGTVLDADNRALLAAEAWAVWLRAAPATLAARVGDGAGRPLLAGHPEGVSGILVHLAAEREPLYEQVAAVVVDVDPLTPEEVTRAVAEGLDAISGGMLRSRL